MIEQAMNEMERSLVCAMMACPHDIEGVSDVLCGADFVLPEHRRAFDVLLNMYASSGTSGMTRTHIVNELRRSNLVDALGGSESVAAMIHQGRHERDSVLFYARKLAEMARTNRALSAARKLVRSLEANDSWDEKRDRYFSELDGIGEPGFADGVVTGSELVAMGAETLRGESNQLCPTGLQRFDNFFGGFGYGQMIVLAARPSVGKSMVGAEIAARVADTGRRVLFVSLEMGYVEMSYRMMARENSIDLRKFRTDEIRRYADDMATTKLTDNLMFWVKPGVSMRQVGAMAKRLKASGGLDMVVVDYLGLMGGTTSDVRERVEQNSMKAKELAVELNVVMVLASQLNRDAEKSEPSLANLAKSGSIEQDADMVIALSRNEKEMGFAVLKNRNGPIGKMSFEAEPEYSRISDYSPVASSESYEPSFAEYAG